MTNGEQADRNEEECYCRQGIAVVCLVPEEPVGCFECALLGCHFASAGIAAGV